jgi:hypothetical protein
MSFGQRSVLGKGAGTAVNDRYRRPSNGRDNEGLNVWQREK